MSKSLQLRIRLMPEIAKQFLALPPRSRGRAVSMLLAASVSGIDLKDLLAMRRELVNLGTLINQSLRTSLGESVDKQALERVSGRLQNILK